MTRFWYRLPNLLTCVLLILIVLPIQCAATPPDLQRSQSLNGDWNLWFDTAADWQHEKLYLNPTSIEKVDVHAPSIGWDAMLKNGDRFPVPSTWDTKYPRHHGVGWYWRSVRVPAAAHGKVIQLRFAAVRERAEVFWNHQLVGYSIEGFTPFVVDITKQVRFDQDNLLAVRVTNPGGGYSWMDFNPIPWGDVRLPDSHDFGGIWQDVDLLILPQMHIQNVYAATLEDLTTLQIQSTIANNEARKRTVTLAYSVFSPSNSSPVVEGKQSISVSPGSTATGEIKLQIPHPELWSPQNPNRYRLVTTLQCAGMMDTQETAFGVRLFTEKDGRLFLNGQRVVVRSSINFGYYPYTVSYPTPDLAEKEVRAAKTLGLNTLSCHRTCCTPALLDAADRLGLMIYEEPGGAPRERQPEPKSPAEAFERQAFLEKLSRLVERDRNHPALVWWNMTNEAFSDKVDDPRHLYPYIDQMMRETHQIDPSRFVTYTSGKQSIVMFRPFAQEYGLIYDFHTVLIEPAVWRDVLTIEHSSFRAPLPHEVFYNGESLTMDSLGDLPNLATTFAKVPDGSYEAEWRGWADMLARAFTQYDLGRFFKTPAELCRLIGLQQGSGFSRELESVRLSDAASGLAINGWDSHPGEWVAENGKRRTDGQWTSGLVNTLRDFNFPPEMLAKANEPFHLAVVTLPSTAYVRSKVQVSVTAINESHVKGRGRVVLKITGPDGNARTISEKDVDLQGDALKFVQPLLVASVVPAGTSGYYKLTAELSLESGPKFLGEQRVLAENPSDWKLPTTGVQLEDPTRTLSKYFEAKTIFYPDLASPTHSQQPVLLIYNPEGGDFNSWYWSEPGLKQEVAQKGRTALLWATDTAHGQTVIDILRRVHALPDNSAALPLGMHWFGGWEFNTPHPIFAGLPSPVIYDVYFSSAYAYWGITNFPGKLMAGMVNAPPEVAVTLGELQLGKGKVLVCSMNLLPYLDKDPVADRILAQMLAFAIESGSNHSNPVLPKVQ